MITLNTEIATDNGTLVAVRTVKHGIEVYVIYLMGSATSLIEAQLKLKARSQEQLEAEAHELAHQLDGKEITLGARVGAKGRLFGSITSADIAAELQKTTGLAVDKRKIELDKPIHQLGSYEATVRLTKDIIAEIKVTVIERETS